MATPQQSTSALLASQPHSLEAERTVLGALLLDPDAIIKVSDFLSTEDFYDPTYKQIFATIFDLYQKLSCLLPSRRANDWPGT